MKSNLAFVRNPGNSYSHAILGAAAAVCRVKRIICKIWARTLAKSADPDQMLHSAASDQSLHCLLKKQEIKA